jgi:hypothetical protein
MRRISALLVLIVPTALTFSTLGLASSPPIGPLPSGPTTSINTTKGQLVAFALPRRTGGKVWRIARRFESRVVRQVSEATLGQSVVLVFKAVGRGTTTVTFALTRGETAKAFEARRFRVSVR